MDKSRGLIKTIFGLDNPVMRAAERIFDLVVLNLLFVLTCLPIVTMGMGRIALYRTLADLREQGRLPLLATYWRHVKTNWKQGLAMGLVDGAISFVALFDLFLVQGLQEGAVVLLTVVAYAALFLSLAIHAYSYPLAGKYQMSLRDLYLKAFLLAGLNLHWTLIFLLSLGLVIVALLSSSLGLLMGLSALLIFGFSTISYAYVVIMEGILAKYKEQR